MWQTPTATPSLSYDPVTNTEVATVLVGALPFALGQFIGPDTAAPVPVATPVPTLNEWGTILFMLFAGLGSVYYLRKYRRV